MTRSPLLLAYRAATALFEPAAHGLLRWRVQARKEDPVRLGERTGRPGRARPAGALAWLHGASLGEGLALLPLVQALCDRGFHVLVTTGTLTSARVLATRLPAGATHQFAPLDVPRFVRRFLDHWRPDLVALAESELWPNLVAETRHRRLPLFLVNARMSARSMARWARARGFIGALLDGCDLCFAQSEADAERFRTLGARHVRATGNMKYDVPPPPADPAQLSDFVALLGARPVWVAASTHAEEEDALLDVHAAVVRDIPDILTILVPRQPARGPILAGKALRRGIRHGLRSRERALAAGTALLVADTVGELGLFYRLSGVVFLGKSLTDPGGGGQNPIEAAKLGCALLHGPAVGNFADVYADLDAVGGALPVADAAALAEAVVTLLSDLARMRRMGRAASDAVAARAGATARVLRALEPVFAAIVQPAGAPPPR